MPRKPTAPSKLTAEERRIEKEREELLRQQRALEERLVTLPLAIEKQRSQFEREARERARRAGSPIAPGRARTASRRTTRRPQATPRKRAKAERVKLFALLAIFVGILLLLLRAIPQG